MATTTQPQAAIRPTAVSLPYSNIPVSAPSLGAGISLSDGISHEHLEALRHHLCRVRCVSHGSLVCAHFGASVLDGLRQQSCPRILLPARHGSPVFSTEYLWQPEPAHVDRLVRLPRHPLCPLFHFLRQHLPLLQWFCWLRCRFVRHRLQLRLRVCWRYVFQDPAQAVCACWYQSSSGTPVHDGPVQLQGVVEFAEEAQVQSLR
ncbi:hypothetical protein MPH_00660 [Macrophomina phaseolina MS6]|uniref:Uncharacterized protein n=1 Tax=Macrophomina phaseolina (strain MS6) TaxID=1126212 RepID=K2SI05_MACPH|nr:hypothetical protein MPH_00660 [Macrophomina phaseolina MS6]